MQPASTQPQRALVLLVHANGFCKETLHPLQRELEAALRSRGLEGVTAVSMDLLGHGDAAPVHYQWDSDMRVAEVDWEAYGAQVRQRVEDELQKLAAGPSEPRPLVFGFGHSLGGAACVLAALQAESLFDGLVLFEPVLFKPSSLKPGEPSPKAKGTLARRRSFASREDALAWFRGKPLFADVREEAVRLYCEHGLRPEGGAWVLKCLPEVEAANFATGMGPHSFQMLQNGSLRVPALVLSGATSSFLLKPANYERLLARCPRVSLETLECGHLGPMEQPDAVAAVAARRYLEWAGTSGRSRL